MKILERYSAKFLERGFAAQRDRLIAQPIEGNAWQADHIVAVHVGGGCSGLDNMRTLCVCCHKEVTAEQARERARKRREASAPIMAAAAGRTRVLRRGPPPRGKRRGRKLSDTEDESEGEGEGEEKAREGCLIGAKAISIFVKIKELKLCGIDELVVIDHPIAVVVEPIANLGASR